MVRGSQHSKRTPRGGDAIKKLILNLKLLKRQVQLRWLRTSSQLRAINMLKKSYFVLDNNNYDRSYKNAFLFNLHKPFGIWCGRCYSPEVRL